MEWTPAAFSIVVPKTCTASDGKSYYMHAPALYATWQLKTGRRVRPMRYGSEDWEEFALLMHRACAVAM